MNIRLCDCRIGRAAGQCIEMVMGTGARKATKYLSGITVVKATRQRKPHQNDKQATFIVTVGAPNCAEQKFIKMCKKSGVAFPVREIQLKWYK